MKYSSGIKIKLGDLVTVNIPEGDVAAKVVMLGETYEHLPLEESFLKWVLKDKVLQKTAVVVEWLNHNPFEHNNPATAPVGNYMFTGIDSGVVLVEREK
jgi:hypothetical protein